MKIKSYEPTQCARELRALLNEAFQLRGRASLAIPGGRSPGAVLEALSATLDEPLRRALTLFWVDERAVEKSHADRNDLSTLAAWRKGGAEPGMVLAMPAEQLDLKNACAEYQALINKHIPAHAADAALLGIGEDGHFASLFPDHPGLDRVEDVFYIEGSPKPPPRRMTLSLPYIARSGAIFVLALGKAKGEIVRKVLDHGPSRHIPISLLPAARVTWLLDEEALRASGLTASKD